LLRSYGISYIGCVRQDNEDRILSDESLGLFIVADGMGGQQHGEVAAELAVSTVRYYVEASREPSDVTWPFGYSFDLSPDANRLNTAIRLANRQVWHYAEQGPEFVGMGTTVAAVLVGPERFVAANVGDSRVYLFRNGALNQLTTDDTWVSSLFSTGLLGPEEARQHPMRNVLTQAAGAQEAIDVHIREQSVCKGDLLLISSDGLHSVIDDQKIGLILATGTDLKTMSERLISATRECSAPDNVSVVLLQYDPES
jgi:PPM family protein phosphatase